MAILVIGGAGFIGPRLIKWLIARGETVTSMDVNPVAPPFADHVHGATLVRGDVTRFDDVMRMVMEVKPERLINLAYGLGAGEGNPHQVMLLDVLGIEYPPLRTRVLEVINDVRRQEGLPLVG